MSTDTGAPETARPASLPGLPGLPGEALVRAYRIAYTSRRIDDREIQLKRQNKVFFQISGAGHEAIQTALGMQLVPGVDWVFPYYRDRALCLALGMKPLDMFLDAVGAADGLALEASVEINRHPRGRLASFHIERDF